MRFLTRKHRKEEMSVIADKYAACSKEGLIAQLSVDIISNKDVICIDLIHDTEDLAEISENLFVAPYTKSNITYAKDLLEEIAARFNIKTFNALA